MPEVGKNFSIYFNSELLEKFEIVQQHIGKGVSQSVAHLVEAKYDEIKDGETRRDQIKMLRVEVAEIRRMIEELTDDPTDYTDHA